MARKNARQKRRCVRKRVFTEKHQAVSVQKYLERKLLLPFAIYKCRFMNHWHIAHAKSVV